MIALELLNRQRLFQGLPLDVLQDIQRAVRLQEFSRRDFVLHKGMEGNALLMLVSGRLQVVNINESGREVGISFIDPGDYFGEISLIDGLPRSASIVALSVSVVGSLSRAKALWLFQNVPLIASRIQVRLCGVIRNEIQFRSRMVSSGAYARIFSVICSNPGLDQPTGLSPALLQDMPNQSAIASMANVSRETVSRALSALVQAGIVRKDGRKLLVRDPQVLKQLALGEIALDNLGKVPNSASRVAYPPQEGPARRVAHHTGGGSQPTVIRRNQPSEQD